MAYSENEAQISELMNTYMYTDFNGAPDGSSLNEALHRMESDGNYADNDYYKILRDAVDKNPEYGKLVIGNQSCNMSDFNTNGTVACTVTDPSTQTNYVVYRGTNDGEWLDNAEGMTKEHTIQQERAANYFDKVAEKNGWTQDDNIVVTGHSKGGNKAQYVTMAADHRDLIDTAYPIDGQGFSQEAIDSWKSRYGEDQYNAYRDKMYGINGNNDFVNVLGIPIVPDSHKQYVNTDEVTDRIKKGDRDTNIGGYHDIKYFFMDDDGNYSGKPRGYTDQGPISFAAAEISKDIMSLDTEEKDHCSRAIMQIFENGEGQDYSLNNNGERAGILDYMGLANYFGWKVFEWNDPNLRNLEINKILLDYWKKNAGRKDFDPGKRSGGSAGKQGRGALRISCGRIRQAAGRLNGSYSTEQSLAASVAAIAESFDYDEPVLNRMKSAIRYQENVMRKQAAQLEELSDKLSQIAVCYETSETRIAGELTGRTHRIEW